MNIESWLRTATKKLEDEDISSARLDCLILLESLLLKDRAWILAHPEYELRVKDSNLLDLQIERRAKHEPLAYIRGRSEFFGREFIVSPATLQPRPETETLIELLMATVFSLSKLDDNNQKLTIIDIGTGSGCLAITAKLEISTADVLATEINKDALKIAEQNAKKLNADIKFYHGNLLEPTFNFKTDDSKLLFVANLPYVPDDFTINQAAMQEPKIAIFGGKDGLDLYTELFKQIGNLINKPAFIFTESIPFQHEALAEIAKASGYTLSKTVDLIQVFKI